MSKKRFTTILCVLLIAGVTKAQQQVSKNEARNAAINVLYNKADVLNRSSNTEIDTMFSFSNNRSNVLMYEVVFKNRTAVLLSGSKACLPVLGYYTKPEHDNGAIFDTTNINVPCCLRAFLNDYVQELELSFNQRNIELHYEEQWEELQQSNSSRSNPPTTITVQPLLTTKWGQRYSNDGECDVYNYYVTSTNNACGCTSKRCPAGCTAVAMAQIMKYWNYPVYLPNQTYQYDWCNMPDELLTYRPNYTTERNAIARLIKDCATKANMDYCSSGCGSGASESDARDALVNDFGYSSDADFQRRFWWSDAVWKGRIKANLNQSQPVFYSGFNDESGHAFVCDGYGSDDLFHFNWGWSTGSYETWFTIDNINPNNNYNKQQKAIFYIYPSTSQDYCNFTLPLVLHYTLWNSIYGFPVSIAHQTIPKTATVLESVQAGSGIPTDWHTIKSGESVEYVAHERIVLKPGFKAEAGSHFVARIEPCANCNSAKVTTKSLKNGVEIEEELYIAVGDNEEEQPIGKGEIVADEPQVYPNPTTGVLTIDTKNNNSRIQTIELYNTQGTKLFTFNGNNGFFQEIDISHLPSQVYVLKIQVDGQVFKKKLILRK